MNFRTLEPTKTLQSQLTASYGTYEHTTTQLSLSGSLHKLGFAFQHGVTGGDSILTGLRFEDTSGETYVHDGAFDRDGNLLKLRYPVGHLTLNAFYIGGTNRSSPLCDQWVTILPCGYGPGGSIHSASSQMNLGAQGQIGQRDPECGRVQKLQLPRRRAEPCRHRRSGAVSQTTRQGMRPGFTAMRRSRCTAIRSW